jgi:hypothetical protein
VKIPVLGGCIYKQHNGQQQCRGRNGARTNLTTGDNNIDIGNVGVAAGANTIRIGAQGTQSKAFIAGISATGVSGQAVKVSVNGQLGMAFFPAIQG